MFWEICIKKCSKLRTTIWYCLIKTQKNLKLCKIEMKLKKHIYTNSQTRKRFFFDRITVEWTTKEGRKKKRKNFIWFLILSWFLCIFVSFSLSISFPLSQNCTHRTSLHEISQNFYVIDAAILLCVYAFFSSFK